jgi:tetratricopeptide (TPR) repeat protein
MVPPPFETPQTEVAIRIDASAGLTRPAPIHIDRTVREDEAVATNLALANLVGDMRDQALREFWKQRYDFAEPKAVSASFDPDKRELRLSMDGTTKMDWNDGWYEADHVWVGYKADFSRDPGPDRDAPYAVGYPDYTRVTETILLPPGSGTFTVMPGSDVDKTVAGMEYHRHARIEGDRFVVEESDRALAPEFPASEAPAAQETLRAIAKKSVFLMRPANYRRTPSETQALADTTPTTAEGFLQKAALLLFRQDPDGARAQIDQAIMLDPKSTGAYALRAIADVAKNDLASARADIDKGTQIGGAHDSRMLTAQGLLAQASGKPVDAIAAYSAAIAQAPDDTVALANRAGQYAATGQDNLALADSEALLKLQPGDAQIHLLRANIAHRRGDTAAALREADAILASRPTETYPLVAAARIYSACGKQAEAMHAFDAALALKQESYIYVNRFNIRPKSDMAGRQSDVEAAVKLDPSSSDAVAAKARLQGERDDWAGAVATLATAIARKPADHGLLEQRAVAYAKLGDQTHALKDFDAARAGLTLAGDHNNLCYETATEGVLLAQALDECEKAVALAPDRAGIRDSRAFVLLRLGRVDEALADYDKVLTEAPAEPNSLYGRSLIEARKGNAAAAARDAAAALRIDPKVRERFGDYGLTADASPSVPTPSKL